MFCISSLKDIEVHGINNTVATDGGLSWDSNTTGLASFGGCSSGAISTVTYSNGSSSSYTLVGPQFPNREQIGNLALTTNNTGQFVMNNASTGAAVCSYNGTVFSCNGGSSPPGASNALVSGTTTANDAACFSNTTGTLVDCGSGPGTVTSVQAPASGWPAWLIPSVSNATTTPSLGVTASAIPNAALANSSTTINGQSCSLGGSCILTAAAAPSTFSALTDGATVTLATAGAGLTNAILTLAHTISSRVLNVTGLIGGASFMVVLKQDSTGGAALSLGSGCTWYLGTNSGFVASTTPSLSATANGINILSATYDGSNCYANVR
jgi:hypothetical protein